MKTIERFSAGRWLESERADDPGLATMVPDITRVKPALGRDVAHDPGDLVRRQPLAREKPPDLQLHVARSGQPAKRAGAVLLFAPSGSARNPDRSPASVTLVAVTVIAGVDIDIDAVAVAFFAPSLLSPCPPVSLFRCFLFPVFVSACSVGVLGKPFPVFRTTSWSGYGQALKRRGFDGVA